MRKRPQVPCVDDSATASAASRFGRYKSEEESLVRVPGVRANKELDMLIRVWKSYEGLFGADNGRSVIDDNTDDYLRDYYQVAAAILQGRRFSAKTVERFSVAFQGLADIEHASLRGGGAFFSALVNLGNADSYRLNLGPNGSVLYGLCFRNCRNVAVYGDAGEAPGVKMKSGRIVIEGDAHGFFCQEMEGGTAILNGNAYFDDGGEVAGSGMTGGEIHLNGEMFCRRGEDTVAEMRNQIIHGRIFHKGKLIVDK